MSSNKPHRIEIMLFLIAVAILGISLYFLGPSITGFVIKEAAYENDVNLVITSNGNYTLNVDDIGELKSLKLDGRVTSYGKARVYIESNGIKHLVFDSTRISESGEITASNESNFITGFVAKEEDKDKDKDKEDEKGKDDNESDEDKKKKNKKPKWIGDDEFIVNGSIEINLSKYFIDEDGDKLTYSVSDAEGLDVSIDGEIVMIEPKTSQNLNTTITFIASDGIDSKSQVVELIVIAEKEKIVENKAPRWNSDAASFLVNGITIIDLSDYFIDDDGDNLSYNYGSAGGITIGLDAALMTLAPDEGFFGNVTAVFTAFDGKNLTIQNVLLIVPEKAAGNITLVNETNQTKANNAPKWASEIESFIVNKSLLLDLKEYFTDEDNDALTFGVSDAADIEEKLDNSALTLNALKDNFNTTITITASDSNLSANKDIKLIIPLTSIANETLNQTPIINETNITGEKTIKISLSYNSGTVYDANDNGEESVNGVVDLTVAGTKLGWNADESRLCTRWEVYNAEEGILTKFCNGNSDCCLFFELLPTKSSWNEVYYSTYGKDDAGKDNIVSAQVVYYDVNLSSDSPKSEIYNSEWGNLSVKFFEEEVEFFDECLETCLLFGLNKSRYTLVFEIEDDAILRIDSIRYSLLTDVENTAPKLLENITAVSVSKNKNAAINLSKYFADDDGDKLQYNYYAADNITIVFNGDIATIIPDKGVEGIRYSYFAANDSELIAVSDVFMINVSQEKFRPKVEVGKPVKWQQTILMDASNATSVNLSIPETASNVTITILNETVQNEVADEKIKVIEDGELKDKDNFEIGKSLEKVRRKIAILEEARLKESSKVSVDGGEFEDFEINSKLNELYAKEAELEQQLNGLTAPSNLITANVIALAETTLNETQPILVINESLAQNIEITIEYETEAPIAIEDEINAYTKQVKVVSETSYEDVLSYTNLNDVPQSAVKLYWIQNNAKVLFEDVDYYDENLNGLIDRIGWVIPHLSNQTFEVSITVLNVQSYPTVGGNWTVGFNTSGTGNLSIYGYDGTSYSEVPDDSSIVNDLEYLETKCGEVVLNTTIVCSNGDEMPYEVYRIKKRIAEIKKRLNELNQSG